MSIMRGTGKSRAKHVLFLSARAITLCPVSFRCSSAARGTMRMGECLGKGSVGIPSAFAACPPHKVANARRCCAWVAWDTVVSGDAERLLKRSVVVTPPFRGNTWKCRPMSLRYCCGRVRTCRLSATNKSGSLGAFLGSGKQHCVNLCKSRHKSCQSKSPYVRFSVAKPFSIPLACSSMLYGTSHVGNQVSQVATAQHRPLVHRVWKTIQRWSTNHLRTWTCRKDRGVAARCYHSNVVSLQAGVLP